jgi:DnaJ-class molecular chaperone
MLPQKISKRYITNRLNKYHPDKDETQNKFNEELFKKINEAYDILGNKQKKAYYDALNTSIYPESVKTWKKTEAYEGFYKTTNRRTTAYHDKYNRARERSKTSK